MLYFKIKHYVVFVNENLENKCYIFFYEHISRESEERIVLQ